jgi:hypothetical protein
MKLLRLSLDATVRSRLFFRLLLLVGLAIAMPVHAAPNANDKLVIEYLIDYVSDSEMVFVRNFGKHDAKSAASHIRKKYKHFLDEIDSPEVFIELCASESLITGREYSVIDPQGNTFKTRDWLLNALNSYRVSRASGTES